MIKFKNRKLGLDDLLSYKSIRLELLKTNPINFGSSFEEENSFDEKMWIDRLTKKHIIPLGSFIGDELVAIVLVVLNPRKKLSHVATVNSMYVKSEYRGLGIANALIDEVIKLAKNNGVEVLNLSVVTTNANAIALYKRHGFVVYGEEKKAIKYDNQYIDMLLMCKELSQSN